MKLLALGLGATAVALVVAAGGCSSSNKLPKFENTRIAASAIQGGDLDGTAHPFAVGVCAGNSPGNCFGTCSGTLVLPNMVLTARHCVENVADNIECGVTKFQGLRGGPGNYFVTTNSKMNGTTQGYHSVSQIVRTPGNDVCGNDLAILILSNNVSSSEAVPAIPSIRYDLHDKRISHLSGFTAIGYGITSPSGNDSGTRRIKQNIDMLCLDGTTQYSCKDVPANRLVPAKEFIGGDGTCSGDSGSGSFNQGSFAVGDFVTQGVLSRGGEDNGNCVLSIYTRLDAWRDLIVSTAVTASGNWTKYPKPNPDWTVYEPPVGKDAGTKKDAGGSSGGNCATTGAKVLGAECADVCECSAELGAPQCVSPTEGASQICTKACSTATDCGDGFTCTSGICAAATAAAPKPAAPKTEESSGICSASPRTMDPTKPVPWRYAGALAVAALAMAARRRKNRG
ncbi:MAG: trypsin-like serine protease [Myxococcales bacterium]|jgi:hypothetical protein|nr:trypsin-like serine protease [Myxococcales bacterium]